MMSSGSTRFFLDFDIFSIAPIVTWLARGDLERRGALAPSPSSRTSPGSSQKPSARFVGLVRHHALREERRERLAGVGGEGQVAGIAHGPREKARIEQVQNRVLDAADVLVDRQPVVRRVEVDRRRGLRAP